MTRARPAARRPALGGLTYRAAGVDIDAGERAVRRLAPWAAHEQAAVRRVAGGPCERAAYLQFADVGVAHVVVVIGDGAAALWRAHEPFGFPQFAHEGHAHDVVITKEAPNYWVER